MEMRAFAEQVLFGCTLDDKLARPGPLRDERPGPAMLAPELPGRPHPLRFGRPRAPFPDHSALSTAHGRGRALHAFANHELLAIELMALFLLRFPEAPGALRREVLRSLVEEQQHLRMYLHRMEALGVGFGEEPVNDAFWRSLSRMLSPAAYLAGMPLTFEQANLDFAAHYAQVFEQLGDTTSAALLHKVRQDEIGHVEIGARWFPVLTGAPAGDWFEPWTAHQPAPLTPARARGLTFDLAGRRAAGLSDRFIESVRTYAGTRGRPVERWRADLAVETSLNRQELPRAAREVVQDLAPLVGLLAQDGDEVVVPSPPEPLPLDLIGLPRLRFVPSGGAACSRSWAPDLDGTVSTRGLAWHDKRAHPPLLRSLYEADGAEQVFGPAWTVGRVVDSLAAVEAAREHYATQPGSPPEIVLKAPLGASGRLMRRCAADVPLDATARAWASRYLTAHGGLVVEPWLQRVADLSVPLVWHEQGARGEVLHALIDPGGRPGGHVLGHRLAAWPAGLHRRWNEGGLRQAAGQAVSTIGAALRDSGPLIAAGVDMFLYQLAPTGPIWLRPLVELNARYTMGHLAVVLERRLAHGAYGAWLHVPVASWRAAVAGGWTPLTPEIERRRLVRGHVCTTSPDQARRVVTLLAADTSWRALSEHLPPGWLRGP